MQTKGKPKRGRPSDYSDEIAEMICDRLAHGESLRAICADHVMPDRTTVSRWLARYEEFRDLYTDAREDQAECFMDEIIEIALDSSGDWVEKQLPDGKVVRVFDPKNIDRSRLKIEARKWQMARLAPKKYGNPRR